ncbi:Glycosyltransferase involved in cell wall bisynthesis [Ectothiorhodospira mobilis]|uniref:Glycosyltransferase involved in cell wall bisynthesis n=1 Tax=Ectothiorhodospira mobilis TaxID=195064 RepID=A0A1I4P7E0_ECTMO|nr:glycosyltransferase family 4 protein [Ectothiorhodospira mobilis]SFM23774.1 Glycosyltransferase involved in cell wall bisynthesis [Ectothiorhodospira mobilis]
MRILYHHRIASKDGQYVHVQELTQALQRQGHEIIMVAPSLMEDHEFGHGSRLVARLKRHIPAGVYELLELAYALVAFVQILAQALRHRPDCLYERYNLYLPSGTWASRLLRIPLLLEVNAPLFEERQRFNGIALPRLARWSEDHVWRRADRALPVTQVLAQRMIARGVDPERIRVLANGIDTEKFQRFPATHEAKAALGLEDRLVLGFTGFVREWHGLERVVDLLREDAGQRHLLIVGDGPACASIRERARALGVEDRVTITGIIPRDQVARYVAAFDIALQPDVVDYASPLKLFEYLALGRAIVAPDKANIREILTHGHNGLLFDCGNSDAFKQAVERLCNDAPLRARLSAQARRTIQEKQLTWDHNATRVVEAAARLIEDNRKARSQRA